MGKRILVVDDTKIICIALRMILGEAGYEVDIAADGQEAVDRCRGKRYDLVFLDLMMPRLGGIAACRCIKAINPHTECVLMTGHVDADLPLREQEFVAAGGKIYNLGLLRNSVSSGNFQSKKAGLSERLSKKL
ncbi:MAG: response regulator [Candidatus Omnitrophica bacterium]|nr:response regulator [Candidatus Omnitrophota bacterium]